MELQRLPKATITFVAVAQETSDRWLSAVLGLAAFLLLCLAAGVGLR